MDYPWVAVCVFILAGEVKGKIFKPVELAQKLHSINISDWDIPSFVCLAHNSSRLDTSHLEVMHFKAMRRDITFYGIFGIPEVWLSDCELQVSDVTDENVEDDARCIIKSLSDRNKSIYNRTEFLGALTPHVVDLNNCFNWWEHLPHQIYYSKEPSEEPQCHTHTAATNKNTTHHNNSPHKPHVPVTTTCKCESNSRVIVDVSLISLNVLIVVLCYILWISFVQRRAVKSDREHLFIEFCKHDQVQNL